MCQRGSTQKAKRKLIVLLVCPLPFTLQESVRSKHPQLLYESKLYKILQGGGERASTCCARCALRVDAAVLCARARVLRDAFASNSSSSVIVVRRYSRQSRIDP
jgi:hypothetical protein